MTPGASEQQEQALGHPPTSDPVPCPSPLPASTSDKDEVTMQVTECSQKDEEVAETKVLTEEMDPAAKAAVASAAPLRRDGALAEKEKTKANRNALLNPPRRPVSVDVPHAGIGGFPQAQAVSDYQSATLRFQGTLSILQSKVADQSQGHISLKDMETIHDQFEAFMNSHPIHGPASRRARALAAAAAVSHVNPPKKRGRPPKNVPISGVAGVAPSLFAGIADHPLWHRHDMPHHMANPPAIAGSQWNLGHGLPPHIFPYGAFPTHNTPGSAYSTVSTYAPYMSDIPAPSQADSAAIAIATAAAMAGNAHGGGGYYHPSAMELLQVLSAAHNNDQRTNEEIEDPDELAASALISLGGNIPPKPVRNVGRGVKRAASASKASGGTQPASNRRRRTSPAPSSKVKPPPPPPPPEISPSLVDSQIFALLLQRLGHQA